MFFCFFLNFCILFVYYLVYLCCSYLISTTGGTVTVCVCWWWEINSPYQHSRTHTHTDMHVGGWCVLSQLPLFLVKGGTGTLFDLKSIIVHLNNLACVWTNCVGMICQNWIMLNMHFCVHLKTAELKKKKDCNVKSIYSCLCITGESCVQMYFVYTMLYITEVHSFFGTILYSNSNSSLIK